MRCRALQTTDSARHLAYRWTRCDVGTSVKPLQSGKPQVACCLLALLLPLPAHPTPRWLSPSAGVPWEWGHTVCPLSTAASGSLCRHVRRSHLVTARRSLVVYCQHRVSFRCPLSGRAIGLARGLSGVSISLKELALGFTDSTVILFLFHGYTHVYTVHGGLPSPSLEFCFPCHC